MPRKDTAARRLKEAIARERSPVFELLRPLLERRVAKDPRERPFAANVATELWPEDESIRAAFAAFRLDPADPFDWHRLLRILADVHFGPPGKRGAKQKWNSAGQKNLLLEAAVVREKLPQATEREVAEALKAVRYPNLSTESLQRYLREASRKPKKRNN